jgi:SsrA-binding protein
MTKTREKLQVNVIAKNKRAWYDYHILETWSAGIKLEGVEVKAIRQGNISLNEAWVRVKDNTVTLVICSIAPSRLPTWQKYEPRRERVLLLKKAQIRKIRAALLKGCTVVPLKVYFNKRGLAKLEIATAKGKKLYDKRRAKQERDSKRYGH